MFINVFYSHYELFALCSPCCSVVPSLHGNVTELLLGLLPLVRHVQVASVPHKREIDRGELNYMYVLKQLDRSGYQGWCGLEYVPTDGKTKQNLNPWFASFQRKRHGSAGVLVACLGKQGKPYLLLGEDHKKGHLWGPFWGRPDKTDKGVEHTAVRETVEESLGVLAHPSVLYNALKHVDFHVKLPSGALFLVTLGVMSESEREAVVDKYRAARDQQAALSKYQREMTDVRWVDATELLRTLVLKKKPQVRMIVKSRSSQCQHKQCHNHAICNISLRSLWMVLNV